MKDLLIFTLIIMLMSIVEVYQQKYDNLKAEHEKCYKIKPLSVKGTTDSLYYFRSHTNGLIYMK